VIERIKIGMSGASSDGGMALITKRQNEAVKRRFFESVYQNSKKIVHSNEKEGK